MVSFYVESPNSGALRWKQTGNDKSRAEIYTKLVAEIDLLVSFYTR